MCVTNGQHALGQYSVSVRPALSQQSTQYTAALNAGNAFRCADQRMDTLRNGEFGMVRMETPMFRKETLM